MIAGFELIKLTAWMIRQTRRFQFECWMKTEIELAGQARKEGMKLKF